MPEKSVIVLGENLASSNLKDVLDDSESNVLYEPTSEDFDIVREIDEDSYLEVSDKYPLKVCQVYRENRLVCEVLDRRIIHYDLNGQVSNQERISDFRCGIGLILDEFVTESEKYGQCCGVTFNVYVSKKS